MEKTDIEGEIRANFPSLDEHSSWVEKLMEVSANIAKKKAAYANSIKEDHADRRQIFSDARKAGVDTKALKQLVTVIDWLDKNVTHVHDKIGETAGDTAHAMYEQFALPLPKTVPGESVIARAKRLYAEEEKARKAKIAEEKKALKSGGKDAVKDIKDKAVSGAKAATGTQHPKSDAVKEIEAQRKADAKRFDDDEKKAKAETDKAAS